MIALAHLHIEASRGPLSSECVDRGIISFLSLIEWVEQLPYGRNSSRSDYQLIFEEERGACSTKHALVKAVAMENGWDPVKLYMGVFLMSEKTHVDIGSTLKKYNVDVIPEAHVYLKIDGRVHDITGVVTGAESFEISLQKEMEIVPNQIGDFKVSFHQEYLRDHSKKVEFSFEELWKIREECIENLSQ